jgi:hypothetical protein
MARNESASIFGVFDFSFSLFHVIYAGSVFARVIAARNRVLVLTKHCRRSTFLDIFDNLHEPLKNEQAGITANPTTIYDLLVSLSLLVMN